MIFTETEFIVRKEEYNKFNPYPANVQNMVSSE